MSQSLSIAILFLLSTFAVAKAPKKSFLHDSSMDLVHMESRLNFPYPMKLSSVQRINQEARRLIHFLKRAFVGVSANYTTGSSYSNYGPVIGIQLQSRVGFRLWGGLNQGRTMDQKKDYAMDTKASGINGRRVGIGMKLTGELSVDLEYQTIDGEESVRNNAYIMSLSAPL